MPRRNTIFANNEIYHVFNRSDKKEKIFTTNSHLNKFLEIAEFYKYPQTLRLSRFSKLNDTAKQIYDAQRILNKAIVEIYAYAVMPNHYHFMLKQIEDRGVERYISLLQTSYAKYFNTLHNREGRVFKDRFKAVRIESDEQFMHVVRYIHLNPVTSYLIHIQDLSDYPWTSHPIYENEKKTFINTSTLLSFFSTTEKYITFVADQVDYQRKLDIIKHLTFEEETLSRGAASFSPRGG